MEWHRDEFTISDDRDKVNINLVADLIFKTYWGHRRPRKVVERLVQNSVCFSLFHNSEQIGFARVVTDSTVFSWLSDVVIKDEYRGRGLGRWLMSCILSYPSISGTQFVLQTRSAYRLYENLGFYMSDKLMTREPPST